MIRYCGKCSNKALKKSIVTHWILQVVLLCVMCERDSTTVRGRVYAMFNQISAAFTDALCVYGLGEGGRGRAPAGAGASRQRAAARRELQNHPHQFSLDKSSFPLLFPDPKSSVIELSTLELNLTIFPPETVHFGPSESTFPLTSESTRCWTVLKLYLCREVNGIDSIPLGHCW